MAGLPSKIMSDPHTLNALILDILFGALVLRMMNPAPCPPTLPYGLLLQLISFSMSFFVYLLFYSKQNDVPEWLPRKPGIAYHF